MASERYLTVQDVAAELKVSTETVRRWLRSGRLKGTMLGGTRLGYRVMESDLRHFVATGGHSDTQVAA
jgi:excisionase family DNA binding protein